MLTKRAGPDPQAEGDLQPDCARDRTGPDHGGARHLGSDWLPVGEELSIRARVLEAGGPDLWERFMAELREEHLGVPAGPSPAGRTVRQRLHDAYLAASRAAPAPVTPTPSGGSSL